MTGKRSSKEDSEIKALFQNWVSNPTNPHHLKALAGGMVEWEIRARLQKLTKKSSDDHPSPAAPI